MTSKYIIKKPLLEHLNTSNMQLVTDAVEVKKGGFVADILLIIIANTRPKIHIYIIF